MLSRYEYIDILQKMIASNLPLGLQRIIRNDDQRFGELLSWLMQADWKHEQDTGQSVFKNDNWGYRQLSFKWTIGRLKREFYYHKKYKLCEYSSFTSIPDHKTYINDNNLIYEELCNDILNSKTLKKKEKQYLIEKFIHFKDIRDIGSSQYSAKVTINKGIKKLSERYHSFAIKRINKYEH